MAKSKDAAPAAPPPRLALVTPPLDDTPLPDWLGATLGAGDVAAVIVRLAAGDERGLINRAKAIVPLIQAVGAAAIVAAAPEVATRAGADGCQLGPGAALREAIERLQPDRIVGAAGLKHRHDAMEAAEAGADYVLFGEPDAAGTLPPAAAVVERVGWWAEIFETPCIGHARDAAAVSALAEAGADFVALDPALWWSRDGAAEIQQACTTLATIVRKIEA